MDSTKVGSGVSVVGKATEAADEAARQALQGLAGATPDYGLVFAAPSLPLDTVLGSVRAVAPNARLIGCQTAGELTERGLVHGGVAVMLVSAPQTVITDSLLRQAKRDPLLAANRLAGAAAEASKMGKAKGFSYSATLTLVDGLNGVGETIVARASDTLGPAHRIVGGAAGDEGAFQTTFVGRDREAVTDGVASLHLCSDKRLGVGVGHGLKPTTGKMQVTRASGNVIYEIDGKPAFEAYRAHAEKRGITLEPSTSGAYMIGNELGIYFLNELYKARAPLSVGPDGSLSCAATVAQGASVCILDGDPSAMVAAATSAAKEAQAGLEGQRPAGVLLFDCICRGMIMKDKFQAEIDAVRGVFGDVPLAGFLTYGEIARYRGTFDGWHNTTAVVVAIPS